jgi:hypothetical protein
MGSGDARDIIVELSDLRGRFARTLFKGRALAGEMRIPLEGQNHDLPPSGTYILRLRVDGVKSVLKPIAVLD